MTSDQVLEGLLANLPNVVIHARIEFEDHIIAIAAPRFECILKGANC